MASWPRTNFWAWAAKGMLAAAVLCLGPAQAQTSAQAGAQQGVAVQTQAPVVGFSSPASHVAIMDGDTGLMLYCQDCETPMPPASMSKLMTVLIVAEALRSGRINENTRFRVSERAWRQGAMSDGSHMFLELNSEARVGDLIRGVIIVSANDACIALAEGIAGTEEGFVDLMNRRA
ncbi:MAG: D-alanyl-D-alanine carboxypeptidase family protein, partial [Hyphomonadaceae bacterium]